MHRLIAVDLCTLHSYKQCDILTAVNLHNDVHVSVIVYPGVIDLLEKSVPDGYTSMYSHRYRCRLKLLYLWFTCAIS